LKFRNLNLLNVEVGLEAVLLKIITRTMRLLTRLGALIEEPERTYLAETDSDGALKSLQAASCTYRIALGPRAGQKVLSLRQDSPGSVYHHSTSRYFS
jgi:hypothetical protein